MLKTITLVIDNKKCKYRITDAIRLLQMLSGDTNANGNGTPPDGMIVLKSKYGKPFLRHKKSATYVHPHTRSNGVKVGGYHRRADK